MLAYHIKKLVHSLQCVLIADRRDRFLTFLFQFAVHVANPSSRGIGSTLSHSKIWKSIQWTPYRHNCLRTRLRHREVYWLSLHLIPCLNLRALRFSRYFIHLTVFLTRVTRQGDTCDVCEWEHALTNHKPTIESRLPRRCEITTHC